MDLCDEKIKRFFTYFQLAFCDTDELNIASMQVRYRVQAQKYHWVEPSSFPDQRIADEWDLCSKRLIIFHKPTRQAVGNVRLILPESNISCERKFCFEEYWPPNIDYGKIVLDKISSIGFNIKYIAEVTSLLIMKFRREIRLFLLDFDHLNTFSIQEDRASSLISYVLASSVIYLSKNYGMQGVIADLKASSYRNLRKMGFKLDILCESDKSSIYILNTDDSLDTIPDILKDELSVLLKNTQPRDSEVKIFIPR